MPISIDLSGNCGNHIIQMAITKCVAKKLGYQYSVNPVPSHDYYGGASQLDFFEMDYGLPNNTPYRVLPPGIDNIWEEKGEPIWHINRTDYYPYQPDIFDIPDNTKLITHCMQDATYFREYKEDLKQWFKIKDELSEIYQGTLQLDENLCVINVRAGWEYRPLKTVFLTMEYWKQGVNRMLEHNPKMQFIVITDDVDYCKQVFPFPCYHFGIGEDYWIINNAKNLLLSNSSFPIFAAWLNENDPFTICPKWWARHNVSDGYWANSAVNTFYEWNFMDREGKLEKYA